MVIELLLMVRAEVLENRCLRRSMQANTLNASFCQTSLIQFSAYEDVTTKFACRSDSNKHLHHSPKLIAEYPVMASATEVSHEPGVYINSKGKKTFVPLENNPEVFTELVHRLGVSPELGFYDVYSIDEPELLSFIPRPVHALIFISPAEVVSRVRQTDGTKELTYDGSGEHEPVIWFKQTIGHACGLYALIHSVGNGSAKQYIKPESTLDKLLKEATPLKPVPRADVLYNSRDLEKAHMSVAFKGDSVAPMAEEPNGYHFISFVKGHDGHLYELEGGWGQGPLDRGALNEDEDCLSERALEMGVRKHIKTADGIMEFSMVALATRPESEQTTNGH